MKQENISLGLKKFFENNQSPNLGKTGWKQTEEQKKHLSEKIKAFYSDKKVSEEHKKARNKANDARSNTNSFR